MSKRSVIKGTGNGSVEFQPNEKFGVVVAVLRDTRYDAVKIIEKATGDTDAFLNDRYLIKDIYKGKAVCNFADGDKFNLKYGKDLAVSRLLAKISKAREKAIHTYIEDKAGKLNVLFDKLTDMKSKAPKSDVVAASKVSTVKRSIVGTSGSSIGGNMVKKMFEAYERDFG